MVTAEGFRTVAIVGVGLIGGSFALAIRKAGFGGEIIGVSSPRTTAEAIRLGVIDTAEPLESACGRADLIYLATPILKILEAIPIVAASVRPTALVTDAGSTKAAIVAMAERHFAPGIFLGGHPMAGKASRGVESADADLFQGRSYVLTPTDKSTLKRPVALKLTEILNIIGCRLSIMDCISHDNLVAVTSHLPQIASTALANTVANSVSNATDLEISGPGLADMTRLAGSSYEIWHDIIETNGTAIRGSLDRYIKQLEELRDNLQSPVLAGKFERGAATALQIRFKKHKSD